jgi:hypothetical protein
MHPIAVRIIGGEDVCPAEINHFNAAWVQGWIDDTARHHTADTCTGGPHCVHAPGDGQVEHVARIRAEAPSICTCGTHR